MQVSSKYAVEKTAFNGQEVKQATSNPTGSVPAASAMQMALARTLPVVVAWLIPHLKVPENYCKFCKLDFCGFSTESVLIFWMS